jgi:hypothetical protein
VSIDFDSLLLGPQYEVFGVDAVLTVNQTEHEIRAIDMTSGIEISAGPLSMPTIRAAAFCKAADLAALELQPNELVDASLLINGTAYTIKNAAPKPGPNGKGTGEIMLTLINGDL